MRSSDVAEGAVEVWREKLDFYLVEEASASSPDSRFELRRRIREARLKIKELESATQSSRTPRVQLVASGLVISCLAILVASAAMIVSVRPEENSKSLQSEVAVDTAANDSEGPPTGPYQSPGQSQRELRERISQLSDSQRRLFDQLDVRGQQGSEIENSALETYYRAANYFFTTEDYHEAVRLYDKAIDLGPTWIRPQLLKGMALERLGQWDAALEAYRRADQLQHHKPSALAAVLLNLAYSNFAFGSYRETIMLCERVINLASPPGAPGYLEATTRLAANASNKLGNERKEAEYLRQFLLLTDEPSEERAAASRRLGEIANPTSG